MSDLEAIYLKTSISLQHVLCSIQGWRQKQMRYGGDFSRLLREVEARSHWSQEQICAWRDQRLRDFVRHCVQTVPYYQWQFKRYGISPNDIKTLNDLACLPIMTKEEVKEHYAELVSRVVPQHEQIIMHTSGTTGSGLRFPTTRRAIQEEYATYCRYWRWHGLERNLWGAFFAGRSVVPLTQHKPPFWRYNVIGRQILFSGYHMSDANLAAYADELRRRRPPWLHGYPSLLTLLAMHLLDTGQDLGYPAQWITTASENLLYQQAEVIRRAFGISPRQHYRMAEGVAHISECEQGVLHVDEDAAAVEFVPSPDMGSYRVIGTNFSNPAFPLLRYAVQDYVTLAAGSCSCGRPGRLIADVDGRQEDYVVLKNGSRLGRLDHIFKDMVNVREAQVYQRQRGQVILRIIRRGGYTQVDEARLLIEARRRLGEDTEVVVEYPDTLQRSRTRKLRFVISDMQEGHLAQAISNGSDTSHENSPPKSQDW
jgi:phenylacetate-CoA ligase